MEIDADSVLPFLQIRKRIQSPCTKHIVTLHHHIIIDINIGIRIKSGKNKLYVGRLKQSLVYSESLFIFPVLFSNPLQGFLIHSVKRVLYHTIIHQIGMYGSGHLCREPTLRYRLLELPFIIQTDPAFVFRRNRYQTGK